MYNNTESTEYEIAEAIFRKKPIGIKSYGDITVMVLDEEGNEHQIQFSKTIMKKIYINITLKGNEDFSDDSINEIKENLINHLNSFKAGETVYISALYSYINIPQVITVATLQLSTDGQTYANTDIECNPQEVARTEENLINISIQ